MGPLLGVALDVAPALLDELGLSLDDPVEAANSRMLELLTSTRPDPMGVTVELLKRIAEVFTGEPTCAGLIRVMLLGLEAGFVIVLLCVLSVRPKLGVVEGEEE